MIGKDDFEDAHDGSKIYITGNGTFLNDATAGPPVIYMAGLPNEVVNMTCDKFTINTQCVILGDFEFNINRLETTYEGDVFNGALNVAGNRGEFNFGTIVYNVAGATATNIFNMSPSQDTKIIYSVDDIISTVPQINPFSIMYLSGATHTDAGTDHVKHVNSSIDTLSLLGEFAFTRAFELSGNVTLTGPLGISTDTESKLFLTGAGKVETSDRSINVGNIKTEIIPFATLITLDGKLSDSFVITVTGNTTISTKNMEDVEFLTIDLIFSGVGSIVVLDPANFESFDFGIPIDNTINKRNTITSKKDTISGKFNYSIKTIN